MRTIARWALMPLAIMLIAGCSGPSKKAEAEKVAPSTSSLAATVKADSALSTLGEVVTNSGLAQALEGVGPYTLFAPANAAFQAGAPGVDFTDKTLRAEGAALLQAHIVPGAVTRKDILTAIQGAGGKGVEMRTMGNTLLTFSKNGEDIVATAPDGATARLTGKEGLASNGVLQPVDGLLVKPAEAVG